MINIGTKVKSKQHPYYKGEVVRHNDQYNVVETRQKLFGRPGCVEVRVFGFLDEELEVVND